MTQKYDVKHTAQFNDLASGRRGEWEDRSVKSDLNLTMEDARTQLDKTFRNVVKATHEDRDKTPFWKIIFYNGLELRITTNSSIFNEEDDAMHIWQIVDHEEQPYSKVTSDGTNIKEWPSNKGLVSVSGPSTSVTMDFTARGAREVGEALIEWANSVEKDYEAWLND